MADENEEEPQEVWPKKGSFVFPTGGRYDGDYAMKPEREAPEGEEVPNVLKRSGRGVYKLNGNEYEGDWQDDKMHGNGNFKFMGGSVYNGAFVENKFHGQGKYIWEHGAYYIGAWYSPAPEGNKMHGDGMFVDSVGRQWKGKFYNGQGPGLHTLPANDAPETDLNKTPVAHQPSGKSAKSAGSAA